MSKYSAKSAPKILPPAGTHNARVVRICEIGTQVTDFGDKFKVQVSYELVDESAIFNEDKGEQNFVVHKTYNRSLHKRADLAKDVAAIRGSAVEDGEEFEMDELLGLPCQVEVVITEDEQYANIKNVVAANKKVKIAKAESELKSLYLDENFDEDVYDSLPSGLQDKIAESQEYKDLMEEMKPKSKKGKEVEEPRKKKPSAPVKKGRK